jgi:2-dehydropantoate 2-reductase
MPSFFLDLQSGRGRTEVEWLNGAIVRAGAGVGVPTPVNAALTATLVRLARENAQRTTFRRNPSALLQEVEHAKARTNSQ